MAANPPQPAPAPAPPAPLVAYFGFSGIIDSGGVTRVAAAMNHAVNNGYTEVHLCMSSMGGYVADGIYLYNHIRALPLNVTMYNVGSVASIAVAIFLAAAHRVCSPHAMFMIHPTAIGPFAEPQIAERLNAALGAALADDQRTEDILRQRCTVPDDLLSARRLKDVHISPQDALRFGLVHRVGDFTLPQGSQILQI